MNEIELRAKVIALEAALQAILITRANPVEAHQQFNSIWTAQVRTLNQASPDNTPLTQAIQSECNRLSHQFSAYSAT